MPDAMAREPRPIELLARIDLAARRNIGMRKHPLRANGPAPDNVACQSLDSAHLRLGEIGIAQLVTGIVDLDADGARVDVRGAAPVRDTRVPGPHLLCHH